MPSALITRPGPTTLVVFAAHIWSSGVIGWFAAFDLFGVGTFGVRLRAILMLCVCIIAAVAGISTLVRWRAKSKRVIKGSASVSLAGSGIIALAGTSLLLYQLLDGDPTGAIAVWISVAGAGGWATCQLWRSKARLRYPRSVAIATTVGAVIAIGNFCCTSLYEPMANPVKSSVTATFGTATLSPDRSYAEVPITISIANTGAADFRVLAGVYSVVGRSSSAPTAQTREAMNRAVLSGQPARPAYHSDDSYELIQADSVFPVETAFRGGEKGDVRRVVRVMKPTRYEALLLSAEVVLVSGDRTDWDFSLNPPGPVASWDDLGRHTVDAPPSVAAPGTDFVTTDRQFAEASYLREETRQDRVFRAQWVLAEPTSVDPTGPYLIADLADPGVGIAAPASDRDRLASDRYGLSLSLSGTTELSTLSLVPGSTRPRSDASTAPDG